MAQVPTASPPERSSRAPVSRPFYALIDWAFVALLILCGFALHPLIGTEGLPNGTDVPYHAYRTAEMARSWEHGVLFPRWAEGTYFGYGSPLFHYYASFSYYVGSAFMLGLGMTTLEALRALIVMSVYGMGIGMYGFLRSGLHGRTINKVGALMGALAYVYAPYMVFTEPYGRGAYPELLAFAVFPFVMWALSRTLTTRRGSMAVLTMFALYILITTHNLMALLLTGLIVGWLGWHALIDLWGNRLAWRDTMRPYALGLVAVGGGLMLSAHFWLPALGETHAINLANVTAIPELDYRNHFVHLSDLLALHPRMDEGAINGLRHHIVTFGVAQWTLALTGALTTLILAFVLWRRRISDASVHLALYFGLTGVVMAFLILPASQPLWEFVPMLGILQFPWRFLGAVAFAFAILVAMNGVWLARLPVRIGAIVMAIAISAPLLTSLTALYVPEWTNRNLDTSIGGYLQAELDGRQRGTTFTDEYRPIAVKTPPDATPRLIEDYSAGYPIDKANAPEGVSVTLLHNDPHRSQWRVTSDTDFIFEKLTYDWLGWQADVDGQAVPITPSQEHGLITFPVPAGTHVVTVALGTTPLRTLGITLSALGLVLAFFIGGRLRGITPPTYSTITPPAMRYGIGLGVALSLLVGVVGLREGVAWLNTPVGEAPASVATEYIFYDAIHLLGYDLHQTHYQAGERLRLYLYWFAEREVDVDFYVFVHVSQGGIPLAQNDDRPGRRDIPQWMKPTGYILDEHDITLPADMPPGDYTVYVGMYTCDLMPPGDCGNGYRPTITRPDGSVVGDVIALETITVR